MYKKKQRLSDLPHFPMIRNWAKERGIITFKNETTQVLKLYEEFGELCGGVLKQKNDLIKDSVGDMVVVLTNLSAIIGFDIERECNYVKKDNKALTSRILLAWTAQEMSNLLTSTSIDSSKKSIKNIFIYIESISLRHDLTIDECIDFAWNEIKNRTGKNVNGNFIKDE